jgi:hypothetical protein
MLRAEARMRQALERHRAVLATTVKADRALALWSADQLGEADPVSGSTGRNDERRLLEHIAVGAHEPAASAARDVISRRLPRYSRPCRHRDGGRRQNPTCVS